MKAAVKGYEKAAFYYQEESSWGKRWIAWDAEEQQQKALFYAFIDVVGERIDYLFKEFIDATDEGESIWQHIMGGILRDELKSLIQEREAWFFHDSSFQICVRHPDDGDYFAYDEHGLFWIYSEKPAFEERLKENGFEQRQDALICDQAHWHIIPKDGKKNLDEFKEALIARSVYYEREEHTQQEDGENV